MTQLPLDFTAPATPATDDPTGLVGRIFAYSWGYDQTNVYFYQVVRASKTGKTVWVRRINGRTEQSGFMAGRRYAIPGDFCENYPEIERKRLNGTPGELSFSCPYGVARETTPETAHYASWYA